MKEIIVYVLGAGCSANYGYPLAAGFMPALESFSESLGNDPQKRKLRCCVDETVGLMREAKVQTLDDLAFRIHEKALDDPQDNPLRANHTQLIRIRNAKIATAALLLSLGQKAKAENLDGYHRLLLTMFGQSEGWQERIHCSSFRLLSFNYDRLFEMAVLRAFGINTRTQLLYGEKVLNSGLNHAFGKSLGFADERFCFLKMHGSVGMRIHEDNFGLQYFSGADGERPGDPVELTDERFLARKNHPNPFERDPEPLIVFPWEKDFVRSGRENRLSFRNYIDAIWQHAEKVISSATEIRFIGYSFHQMDQRSVIDLLKKASNCRSIIIQNKAGIAEQICRRLEIEHGITIPLKPYISEF